MPQPGTLESICKQFEKAWTAGHRPRLADYLPLAPNMPRAELLGSLLAIEIGFRTDRGEAPCESDYLRAFPRDQEIVRAVFSARGREGTGPSTGRVKPEHWDEAEEPRVRLEVIRGDQSGRHFLLSGHESFLVGRSRKAHFCVKGDQRLSRIHFMIELNPPRCRICDMESRNGTVVNGERISAAELCSGDVVEAGNSAFRVTFVGDWKGLQRARGEDQESIATSGHLTRTFGTGPAARVSQREPSPPCEVPAGKYPDIPGYRLERELGRGGMGVVYLATCLAHGRPVAIKTLRPAAVHSTKVIRRFLREAAILGKLRHPGIVSFLDLGQAGELLFFAMDYIAGTDAAAIVRRGGCLPVARAISLVCQVLEALEYAHKQGYIHRDVKPGNLLVLGEGHREVCKLADFGLARAYHASSLSGLSLMGDIGGTVPFMPPEQILDYRNASPPADQYSAAATLYFLLCGKYVFDFEGLETPQQLGRILFEEPVPIGARRDGIPPPLSRAIHRALKKNPQERFPDAAAFRQAVLASSDGKV